MHKINYKLLTLLLNFLFFNYFSVIANNNSTEGIDILRVNASLACSQSQPLIVSDSYGYINTPEFDGFHYYPANLSCSWLFIAKQNHSIFLHFLEFELDFYAKDGLYLYAGLNASAPLIGHFSGSRRDSVKTISPGNVLFIRFDGIPNPRTVGFYLYFEQKAAPVHCSPVEISCENGYQCAKLTQFCDGVDDCDDGTDEECPVKLKDLEFSTGCGRPIIKPEESFVRIVGGMAAKPGSWPWMADMRVPDNEPMGHFCGATVLNRQWVLTAAHCFSTNAKPNKFSLHFGKYQKLVRDPNEVIRYLDKVIIHPDYRGDRSPIKNSTWFDRMANDIALVKLNAPLPLNNSLMSAICLPKPNQELEPKDMVWVTGWGNTQWTGSELVLKQVKVPIITNEMCRQWMPAFNVGNSMICAGDEEGGQDSCQGDSGGPLVRMNPKTKNYEILGIVSTGGSCGGRKEAGIYTKVSHFVQWIQKTISEQKLFELKLLDNIMKRL